MKKLLTLAALTTALFADGIKGVGTSGIELDEDGNFGGYIYASKGEGNMENYLSIEDVINAYNIGELEVMVEFDESGKISYLHS